MATMAREWMTRAQPMRMATPPTPAAPPARVGALDSGPLLTFGPNAAKGAALGGALGTAAGLWFGFLRGGHAVGWPMLGWSLLGGWVGGFTGNAVGGLADVGVNTG